MILMAQYSQNVFETQKMNLSYDFSLDDMFQQFNHGEDKKLHYNHIMSTLCVNTQVAVRMQATTWKWGRVCYAQNSKARLLPCTLLPVNN